MFEWLKRNKAKNLTLKSPDGWGQLFSRTNAGVSVSVEQAMRIAAVFACVKIIAETIASTPLHIYRNRPEGGKDRANTHPLSVIFGGVANEENTSQELLEYVLASLLLRGVSYCEIVRKGGKVTALIPLDASKMQPDRMEGGALVFNYTVDGVTTTYQPSQLWRVTGLSSDGVTGYSAVSQGKEALGVALAAEEHAARTFSNGASIPGVYQKDGMLSDEAFTRLKEQLDSRADSLGSLMKPLLLEEGLTYESVSMTLEQAQFVEARKFQIAEVCRIFRVPAHKVGLMDAATFGNIEHQSLEFVIDTLTPWCVRIEQTIRRDLLTANEKRFFYAKFNLEGLLRGDVKTRYEAHSSALNNGWMCANEVRALEDLNPIEGGDVYRIPLNMGQVGDEPEKDPEENPVTALEMRQVNAIRREVGRGDFSEWATDFYDRLAVSITGDDCDEDTAKAYCAKQLKELLAADDVPALLTKWEGK